MIAALLALAVAQGAINPAGCAALSRSDPAAAEAAAHRWRVDGGGHEAEACLGLALSGQERWREAAETFEAAARAAGAAGDVSAPDLWAQAGNGWLAADEPTRAMQAFEAALAPGTLAPELAGEIHLDRARALVALGNDSAARTEIDRGLELVPADPFGWYLSAALARRAGDSGRASADIARALALAETDADIQLLAGTIAGERGDMDEARARYARAGALAPGSDAGRAARAALGAD